MNIFSGLFKKSYQSISGGELATIARQKNAQILDVRSTAEYAQGHIPNARNFDVNASNFENKVSGLKKESTYYVYCRSGVRSARACRTLTQMGFTNVYNLTGGIGTWPGKLSK